MWPEAGASCSTSHARAACTSAEPAVTGQHLPAVKGHFVAAQMHIGVWEAARHLSQQGPQSAVGVVPGGVQGSLLPCGQPLGVVAVCQQLGVPLTPCQRVPCACMQYMLRLLLGLQGCRSQVQGLQADSRQYHNALCKSNQLQALASFQF